MSKNEQCLCPPFQLVPGGVRGTGGLADTVVTTPGGNVVPGTGGTGGPVVTPGGTIGGPVVTPGGTIGGAVGLTPAKCKICAAVFSTGNDNNNSSFASFTYALSKQCSRHK